MQKWCVMSSVVLSIYSIWILAHLHFWMCTLNAQKYLLNRQWLHDQCVIVNICICVALMECACDIHEFSSHKIYATTSRTHNPLIILCSIYKVADDQHETTTHSNHPIILYARAKKNGFDKVGTTKSSSNNNNNNDNTNNNQNDQIDMIAATILTFNAF